MLTSAILPSLSRFGGDRLELVKRVVLGGVQHSWVLDYAVPIGQIIAGIAWRRMSRRRRLNRGDVAMGTDLFLTALAVWLAVLAAINLALHDRMQQANLELAWQVLVLTTAVFVALPHAVRVLWLEGDNETPTPTGVAVQNGLGTLALLIAYFMTTHWLLPRI